MVVLLVVSRWVWPACVLHRSQWYCCMVQSGRLWLYVKPAVPPFPSGLRFNAITAASVDSAPELRWWLDWGSRGSTFRWVYVPLWIPVVGAGAVAAVIWRRELRRRPGMCGTCGYELVGLGVCPECGERSG
jgi:hypothetical protein